MSGLEDIPIQVQNLPSVAGGGTSGTVRRVGKSLQGLLDSGREHSHRSRGLPLPPVNSNLSGSPRSR